MNLIWLPPAADTVKIFNALLAKTDNLLHGPLEQKIFYLHVQKCGGTSIKQAIKACYRSLDITKQLQSYHLLNSKASFNAVQKIIDQPDLPFDKSLFHADDYLELKFRENLLLYYMGQEDINYIAGHFSFSEPASRYFSDQYAFVTVLREPVERWISLYFWRRYNKNGHRNIYTDITTHLKSELAKNQGCGYVKFFGGVNKEGDYTSEQAINRAKENLHKFSVVGALEYQEDFVKQFEERFGRKLKIRNLNQSPKSKAERSSVITEEIKEEIRAICKPDIEIYQYALENFIKAKN